jgi:hypothetical protein
VCNGHILLKHESHGFVAYYYNYIRNSKISSVFIVVINNDYIYIYIYNLVLKLCFSSITSFYAQIHINLSRIVKERKKKDQSEN